MKAWIVWTPIYYDQYCGVVVYAETRGQARWSGAAEMDIDEGVLDLSVVRAPLADHLAESRVQPERQLLHEMGLWDHE